MTAALALGLAWTVVVLMLAATGWRPPARLVDQATRAPASRPDDDAQTALASAPSTGAGARLALASARIETERSGLVARLGTPLRRLAGRPPDPAADRRVGWAVVATVGLAWLAPALSPLPPLWAVASPKLAAKRAARAHEAAVVDQLPDVVDLLALTTSAGLSVSASFPAIGDRPGGPLGTALAAAAAHVDRGGTTTEALTLVAQAAGPTARPLVDALAEHTRYGTPLGPSLNRVAIEARLRRRRQAEEAARRLPVTLLFPLVLTTLPAFVLLTVLPLLAGSFSSLSP